MCVYVCVRICVYVCVCMCVYVCVCMCVCVRNENNGTMMCARTEAEGELCGRHEGGLGVFDQQTQSLIAFRGVWA